MCMMLVLLDEAGLRGSGGGRLNEVLFGSCYVSCTMSCVKSEINFGTNTFDLSLN